MVIILPHGILSANGICIRDHTPDKLQSHGSTISGILIRFEQSSKKL